MTVSTPENKTQDVSVQEKVDTNLTQQKVDTNLTQKPIENKETETSEDPNWKAFREARKKDRAEREAAEKRAQEKESEVLALKAAMEAAFSKSAPSPQAYQQYYGMNNVTDNSEEETEDQRIEKKVAALLAAKEERQRRENEEHERQEYPNRLQRDFPDFNQVIAQENLDYIDYHYPEVSRPLQRLPEGYDRWADIYRAIKKFVPNNATAKKEAAKAEANFNKPKSISSIQPSQTGENAPRSMMDVERSRAENWARMQRIIKQV